MQKVRSVLETATTTKYHSSSPKCLVTSAFRRLYSSSSLRLADYVRALIAHHTVCIDYLYIQLAFTSLATIQSPSHRMPTLTRYHHEAMNPERTTLSRELSEIGSRSSSNTNKMESG